MKNLSSAVEKYQRYLPGSFAEVHRIGALKIGVVWLGEQFLEFLCPEEGEEIVKKFLEKRGEGIHHIAFQVENLDEELRCWQEAGAIPVDAEPRIGLFQRRATFFHPKTNYGVLIELVEGKPFTGGGGSGITEE